MSAVDTIGSVCMASELVNDPEKTCACKKCEEKK